MTGDMTDYHYNTITMIVLGFFADFVCFRKFFGNAYFSFLTAADHFHHCNLEPYTVAGSPTYHMTIQLCWVLFLSIGLAVNSCPASDRPEDPKKKKRKKATGWRRLIAGQNKLYSALSNLRAGPWVAAVLVEHLFRKGDFVLYDLQSWNVPSKLLLGAAALTASALI
ncbi:hypothetical protein EDB86DRAFT_3242274 [Lactarius hatsudake]|nr:hypothetical protein EDB86DRAFT_3242274 [Lactarius hatsudake]